MKTITLATLLALISPVALHAQAVSPKDLNVDKTPELNDAQREFTNLPEQKRIDYINHTTEATRLFGQKRIFETLEQTDSARKIFDRNADVLNMVASCYVEFRDFTKAREFYGKALALAPQSSVILFNIAELEFVTRNWQACLEKMKGVLPMIPESGIQTRRIIELKMLLCHIALNQVDEAKALANKYDPLRDDTPFYYYAQACLKYLEKDIVKAEDYLQMANRVFVNPAYISPWQDTLIEFGYISSFYGGEPEGGDVSKDASPAPQPPSGSGAK
jgi:tetratricopeptide (TPR) repeat protein